MVSTLSLLGALTGVMTLAVPAARLLVCTAFSLFGG